MIFKLGPFEFYRAKKNGTLDITLNCMINKPWGWEYGWRDDLRGTDKPLIEFRIGKIMVFYFERFKKGYEIWLLGFWVIF